ncbi:MAG TPA: TadE family protein [Polyangia bacterium]|nr:TadE family protein [Polyangia bacterium]
MRLTFGRILGRTAAGRSRQRGAAVVEFALCLFILVPMVLAMVDWAYYFYISINIVNAQREGLVAASQVTVTDCTLVANAAAKASAITAATTAEAAYLTNAGITGVTLVNSSPACPCAAAVSNTCWDMSLAADFTPILGWVAPWMKKSPLNPTTQARYTARTLVVAGK